MDQDWMQRMAKDVTGDGAFRSISTKIRLLTVDSDTGGKQLTQ